MDIAALSGQIVHATGTDFDGVGPAPAHHLKVELLAKRRFQLLGDSLIAWTRTDDRGQFSFDLERNRLSGQVELKLRISENPWHLKNRFFPWSRIRTIREVNLGSVNANEGLNTGALKINFWEYQKGWPRLEMPEKEEDQPQKNSWRYGFQSFISGLDESIRIKVFGPYFEKFGTIKEVDLLFGRNLTSIQERRNPGSTTGGEWTADRILNGFNPAFLEKTEEDGVYQVNYNWAGYTFDGVHYLPDAKVKMAEKNGVFCVNEVALRYRNPPEGKERPPVGEGSSVGEWKTWKEADEGFKEALREFRMGYMVAGETDMHLGRGHLNVEQYAVAAFRNLHDTPLAKLLFPHQMGVVIINNRGNDIIFGEKGVIPGASAMTPESVEKRLREVLGSCDWKGFHPRTPMNAQHNFAHIANTYWNILTEHVEEFFAENREGIEASWGSLRAFSKDLVRNAYPHNAYMEKPHEIWQDNQEIADPSFDREIYEGVKRAVSPVILGDQPNDADIERLKACCRYIIFFSTFWHSWCNDHQKDDGGQASHTRLGRQDNREGEVRDALRQIFLVHYLVESSFGKILQNERGDIPEGLIAKVKAAKGEFEKWGYNIEDLRSETNI